MDIQYPGGVTRETVHCEDCGTKRRPLKWYNFYAAWLCPAHLESRIQAAVTEWGVL